MILSFRITYTLFAVFNILPKTEQTNINRAAPDKRVTFSYRLEFLIIKVGGNSSANMLDMIFICIYMYIYSQENRVHMTFKPLLRGVPKIVEIFIHEKKETFSRLARDFSASFIYISNKRLYNT